MKHSTEKYYNLKLTEGEAKKLKHICQSYNPDSKEITRFEREAAELAESIEIFINQE